MVCCCFVYDFQLNTIAKTIRFAAVHRSLPFCLYSKKDHTLIIEDNDSQNKNEIYVKSILRVLLKQYRF